MAVRQTLWKVVTAMDFLTLLNDNTWFVFTLVFVFGFCPSAVLGFRVGAGRWSGRDE